MERLWNRPHVLLLGAITPRVRKTLVLIDEIAEKERSCLSNYTIFIMPDLHPPREGQLRQAPPTPTHTVTPTDI